MTDHAPPPDEPVPGIEPDDLAALHAILDDPSAWADPSPAVEDLVVAAIRTEDGSATSPPTGESPRSPAITPQQTGPINIQSPTPPERHRRVTSISDARSRAGRPARWLPLAAAAALVVIALGALAAVNLRSADDDTGEVVALAGTEAAPGASGAAVVDPLANGLRIDLTTNLEPAPDGFFYTAWVVREEPRSRIPAGSFHMRSGAEATIELWAGVPIEDYPLITVTLQSEDDPAGPGELVLSGRVDDPG